MITNNNKESVNKIAFEMIKTNKVRNIFVILAIVLTTFLISSVFTIGLSTFNNYDTMMKRHEGTTASIGLNRPTEKQYEQIKELDYVEDVGKQISIGTSVVKDNEDRETKIRLVYYDKTEFNSHIKPTISDIYGNTPQKADEIMIPLQTLEILGIKDPEKGMKIKLDYTSGENLYSRTFDLSGWYKNYKTGNNSGTIFVSGALAKETGMTLRNNGSILISTGFGKQQNVFDRLSSDVKIRQDQEFATSFDIDSETKDMVLPTAAAVGIVSLFIIFSGYLLIYNIMYISVVKDTRFFGLLKAIGTTPKQIKKIVRTQIYLLSVVGILTGLLLSLLSSFVLLPNVMSSFIETGSNTMEEAAVSFSPLIFIGAALFALITVVISARKPAKIASRISPVEAVVYTGITAKKNKKTKKTGKGFRILRMAFGNIFRDRKRAMLVFVSLFMGAVTLLSVNSFFGSLDPENYVKEYYPHDFNYQLTDPAQYAETDAETIDEKDKELFTDDFIENIKDIDGVRKVTATTGTTAQVTYVEEKFEPILREQYDTFVKSTESNQSYEEFVKDIETVAEEEGCEFWMYGIDDSYVENYNKENPENRIDVEAFRKGEICIIGDASYDSYKDMLGVEFDFTNPETGNTKITPVGGIFGYGDAPFANYAAFVGAPQGVYVSKVYLEELFPDAPTIYVMIDVDPAAEPAVKNKLEKINEGLPAALYHYEAKSEEMNSFRESIRILSALTVSISTILFLIGIMNFINVMLTGVYNRKKEFAVMESIGTTKKQIRRMLLMEGGCYAVITLILILTLGSAIIFSLSAVITDIADYAVFEYPVGSLAALTLAMFTVCLIIPGIIYKVISKDSIIDRLHAVEI